MYDEVMPNKPAMRNRVVRVPDTVWDAAMSRAAERQENLSEAIRAFLKTYAENDEEQK